MRIVADQDRLRRATPHWPAVQERRYRVVLAGIGLVVPLPIGLLLMLGWFWLTGLPRSC